MAANLTLIATVAKEMLDLHQKEKDSHAGANALLERILEKVHDAQQAGKPVDEDEVKAWLRAVASNRRAARQAADEYGDLYNLPLQLLA